MSLLIYFKTRRNKIKIYYKKNKNTAIIKVFKAINLSLKVEYKLKIS